MSIFNEHTWWYLARASGIVAVVLLVLSVVWGIALSTRVSTTIRPAWTLEVHKWLSGLAFCATALHLLGLVLDGYIDFGFAELFVPGASSYRPFAVAVGVFTLYGMLAVQVTSWARKHLTRAVWHAVHMLSYAVVWGGLLHAGLAGTDTMNRAYQLLAAVMITITFFAVSVRVFARPRRARRRTPVAAPRPSRPASTPPTVAASGLRGVRQPIVTAGSTRQTVPVRRATPVNAWIDPLIVPVRRPPQSTSRHDRR